MKISCKMCGANLKYIPSIQKACCEHCGSSFAPEKISYDDIVYNELEQYVCSSCGAELISTGKTEIINCIYCGGKEFVNGKTNNEYILEGIFPFKIDREQFIKSYGSHLKNVLNVEKDFIDKIKEATITGFYLPYSFANNFFRKQYSKILNELLEEIIPYNFKELKKMNPIYLDNFLAETVKTKKEDNDIKTNDPSFFLVPVWIAQIEYKKENYFIVMNGQTGEMAGIYKKETESKREKSIKKEKKIVLTLLALTMSIVGIYGVSVYVTKKDFTILGWFIIIVCFIVAGIIGNKNANKDRILTEKEQLELEKIKSYRKEFSEKGAFTTNKVIK